jgi:hypothetical protein
LMNGTDRTNATNANKGIDGFEPLVRGFCGRNRLFTGIDGGHFFVRGWRRMKAGKFLKYLVLAVVAVNVMIIAAMLLGSASETKPTPMPNPNGYDDFVRAAKALVGSDFSYTHQTGEELINIVLANSEALKFLHEGVTKECLVPEDHSTNIDAGLLGDLASFKTLTSLECLEGELAEMDGKTNDAMKVYLDSIRFAGSFNRGGVLLNKLVGIACEAVAMRALKTLEPSLDAKQCAEAAGVLAEIDAKAETVETVLAHEKAFNRRTGGLRGQFTALVMYKTIRAVNQRAIDKINANTIRRRQAMVSFAARAYELDKGKPPASIADLIPAYLKAIPQDPVTKTNLTYVP